MNSKEILFRLITLAEKLVEESDTRTLAQIEIDGDLPSEIVEARILVELMK